MIKTRMQLYICPWRRAFIVEFLSINPCKHDARPRDILHIIKNVSTFVEKTKKTIFLEEEKKNPI
jgi:hypothetical protein